MFRIYRLTHLLNIGNKAFATRSLINIKGNHLIGYQKYAVTYRSYCQKNTSDSKDVKSCPPSGVCDAKIPKKVVCEPKKPPPNYGPIIGILLATAALGALYLMGLFDSKSSMSLVHEKKRRPKRPVIKDPPSVADLPKNVQYLLVGGGTASFSAFRAIKSADPTARILIISNESFYPYMRPPLSKEMWFNTCENSLQKLDFKQWNGAKRNLYFEPEEFYTKPKELNDSENGGVSVARGYNVKKVDCIKKKIVLAENNYEIEYEKCLIATGASPKLLPVFQAALSDPDVEDRVKIFRNIYDFQESHELFEDAKSVAVIGSGFLGSELACVMARKGNRKKEILQIFRENGVMGKILPEYLSNWTTTKMEHEGVSVMANSEVIGVKYENEKLVLTLTNGKKVHVDFAVVAVGVEPNTELARSSQLEVDPELGGFVVNTELQARTDVYVAGDCACFYDVQLGRRRIEHFDQAVVSGRLAGENMTGKPKPYTQQSMFWSDLGPDIGFEAIGVVDACLPTVGVFAKGSGQNKSLVTESDEGLKYPSEGTDVKHNLENSGKPTEISLDNVAQQDYGKGVIFYLRDDVVVGVVLWNLFNRMAIARQVIKDGKQYADLNEVAKLFNIHDDE